MELIAFMIFQSGEMFTRGILKRVCNLYDLVSIIRRRTDDKQEFSQKVRHLYEHLDPSKKESVQAKILAQGNNTSLLIIICKGDKANNKLLKEKVRLLVGHNCIHSFDSEKAVVYMLKYLLSMNDLEIDNFRHMKGKDGVRQDVHDFLHKDFIVVGEQKSKEYFKLDYFYKELVVENMSSTIMNIGPKVSVNIEAGKDIDIITSNRTRLVDRLGAVYRKGESVYHVTINNMLVKVDFSMSVDIPIKWRNHILTTKVWNAEEGFYQPQDVDIFWLHVYDRTILKPHKFKADKRYGKGAKHKDLIAMGKWLGITPTIKEKDKVGVCAEAANQYLKKI